MIRIFTDFSLVTNLWSLFVWLLNVKCSSSRLSGKRWEFKRQQSSLWNAITWPNVERWDHSASMSSNGKLRWSQSWSRPTLTRRPTGSLLVQSSRSHYLVLNDTTEATVVIFSYILVRLKAPAVSRLLTRDALREAAPPCESLSAQTRGSAVRARQSDSMAAGCSWKDATVARDVAIAGRTWMDNWRQKEQRIQRERPDALSSEDGQARRLLCSCRLRPRQARWVLELAMQC